VHIEDKLAILADAAKYDVSCASSGSRRRNMPRRLGNAAPSGICHTYTEDGRCVSLLKVLYTNACIYDCDYCVNRIGNDIPRAAFTPNEIVSLTVDFYRRNYIEGLFLSSGIRRSPDDTMARLAGTAKGLREQGFNGYIHLKCVPFASRRLIRRAGLYADRLSINIELPSEESLVRLTRDKTYASVLGPMGVVRDTIAETRADRKRLRHVPPFAPAGQSTQIIIGASSESDRDILALADRLYRRQALRRVYYSAYLPVERAGGALPDITEPPLKRENRLYQADWLMRLYGFALDEVVPGDSPHLDLKIDPKLAFALRQPALFPIDINAADRDLILKVPGIGLKSVNRILSLRRRGRIRFEHLRQLGVMVARAQPFIRCDGLPTTRWGGVTLPAGSPDPPSHENQRVDRATTARLVFVTDGTFDGLLSAMFDAYAAERPPDAIEADGHQQLTFFERRVSIPTDTVKSDRVWRGLKKHLKTDRRRQIFEAYLSGADSVENSIYRFVRDRVPGGNVNADLSLEILIEKLAHKVRREAHRMKGFVRFQRIGPKLYLAVIEPCYDVLPVIRRHFELRFSDQAWIIYDKLRNYGLSHDRHTTQELQLPESELVAARTELTADEQLAQALWQRYYAAANIAERSNPALHRRQLPRRYWRYLSEKQN
jgi:probable DNA metabolism protein